MSNVDTKTSVGIDSSAEEFDRRLRDELLSRVDAIAPILAADTAHANIETSLSPRVVSSLSDAELFGLFTSTRFGGLASGVRTASDVIAAVAGHCASSAWVLMIVGGSNLYTSRFSDQAQVDVFGANPAARVGSVLSASDSLRQVDGGWMVNGSWGFSSGVLHDDWMILGGFDRAVLVPVAELEIERTWDTVGMRGTGSHTSVAKDVFVPDHRSIPVMEMMGLAACANTGIPAGMRVAPVAAAAVTVSAVVYGIARSALELVTRTAHKRGITATVYQTQVDSQVFTANLGECAVKIDSAGLLLADAADALDRAALAGQPPSLSELRKSRAMTAHAARLSLDAIDELMWISGASAFANANPLAQKWKDANTAARHALVSFPVGYETYGGALLGKDPVNFLL
ncbi:acyl-CoA dehydrogenase family protein [Nocardia salmonicida]|uniref:acyl-CoA dehydrogenase family protein n=1 Tax=Nocardia salmonicida TaxID=53431 RepID=UPI0036732F94